MKRCVLFILPALIAAGCASTEAPAPVLGAELTSPHDITVTWTGAAPGAAGQVLEYTNQPGDEYTILQFLPAAETRYEHPDLVPDTQFFYRQRSYFGPASEPVDVTLPPGEFDERAQALNHEWSVPTAGPADPVQQPMRGSGQGVPTGFAAEIKHANGIRFTWVDHASDEDGYLLEVKREYAADFTVAASLDPDITSFGLITMPEEKNATYRVRPYYFGEATDLGHRRTGPDGA